MKTKIISLAIVASFALFFAGCGGSGIGKSSVNNEFLNKLPSIANEYDQQIVAKEKEIHECTDMNKAFKLEKELDLLKEEWATKIKESNSANPITRPLPFEALAGATYQVKQITIDPGKVYKSNVTMNFDVTIPQDIKNEFGGYEKNLFIFFLALDKAGKEIPGVVSVATNYNRNELKAGTKLQVFGQLGPLSKLETFARLRLLNKEEYDQKKK